MKVRAREKAIKLAKLEEEKVNKNRKLPGNPESIV
jgi:hypothetical protein